MKSRRLIAFHFFAVASAALAAGAAHGAVIASYQPGTLAANGTPTAVSTLSDSSGNGKTLTSTGGTPYLYGAGTTGYDTSFNNRNYISYSGAGVSVQGAGLQTAAALFTGSNDRSVAAVYDAPVVDPATFGHFPGGFEVTAAGETTAGGGGPPWFAIQDRDNNVIGAPYLVTAGADISSGAVPVQNLLTFALATYNGTTQVESLYWAYGTTGAIQSASLSGVTLGSGGVFQVGIGSSGDVGNYPINVGNVLVYDSALSSAAAQAEIRSLQAYYTTPEPSTFVLGGLGLAGLLFVARQRKLQKVVATSLVLVVALGGLGSAGMAWGGLVPIDSANLIANYNADTIHASSTPTTITTWTDLTGNGHNATSAIAGLNPVTQAPSIYSANTAGYNALAGAGGFGDNHSFLNFNLQGLAATSMFSGAGARTVVVAYENAPGSGTLNELAGVSQTAGPNTWFMLQARTSGLDGGGNPYLAGYVHDLSSGTTPVAQQLTFAVATYDGTNADMSWAYGLHGTVQENGPTAESYNTLAQNFSFGFSNGDAASGHSELGMVLVYNSALSAADAATLIGQLQNYYAAPAPEPSTFVLGGLGLAGLSFVARRRKATTIARREV